MDEERERECESIGGGKREREREKGGGSREMLPWEPFALFAFSYRSLVHCRREREGKGNGMIVVRERESLKSEAK